MAWIELHQAVWTHRKTFQLADALDLDETYAAAHVIRLWSWAIDNAPGGCLGNTPARVLARASGWTGDADAFVSALVESGWLDEQDDGYRIHDWADYAGRLIERREANAQRMREARAAHVQRTNGARAGATGPNRTQPDQTGQNPTVPEQPEPARATPPPAVNRAAAAAGSPPDKFRGVDEIFQGCRGYKPSARLWEALEEDYAALPLEREALKLASYLDDHPKSGASTRQILNWFDVAKRRNNGVTTGPPGRAAPAAGASYATKAPSETALMVQRLRESQAEQHKNGSPS